MLYKKIHTLLIISYLFLGCTGGHAAVVASVKPLGFIAAAIADGITPVEVLLPDGASEHDYALRPSDIKRIQHADLLVWVGPEMEAFLSKSAALLPAPHTLQLVELSGVKSLLVKEGEHDDGDTPSISDEMAGHHHHHGEYNMHLWMSPEIAQQSAVAIYEKLLDLMPQQKDKLAANLQRFEASLASADKVISSRLAPVKDKGYFVFHDAYRYFERHYGLLSLGYFTVNPEIQPGAQRLHQIRTMLAERKAVCVFAEPQFRPAVIEAVARGTQVHQGTLDPLGTNISVKRDSYVQFLTQLADQYISCLKGN
ncbi:zinc ABC transporter substrate-binding protein ZnuA [Enterobacteriaceae bacterium LUAb1]